MTTHVGEIASTVELQGVGVPAGSGGGSSAAARSPGWDERQRHRDLVEQERRAAERTCGDGFDGGFR